LSGEAPHFLFFFFGLVIAEDGIENIFMLIDHSNLLPQIAKMSIAATTVKTTSSPRA
jgi:hypothetical protein